MNDFRMTTAKGGPWYEYYRRPCEICGKTGACMIHEDGNRVVCIRQSSDIEWGKNSSLPGYLHYLKEQVSIPKEKISTEKDAKKLPSHSLNKVYSELIANSSLTKEHLAHLTGVTRQMNKEEIRARGYFSMPDKPWRVISEVAKKLGSEDHLIGTPGIYYRKKIGSGYYTLSGLPAIGIPSRNHMNEIVGVQWRVDSPVNNLSYTSIDETFSAELIEQPDVAQLKYKGKTIYEGKLPVGAKQTIKGKDGKAIGDVHISKGAKYIWLSSSRKENGTSAGNPLPIHVSVPTSHLLKWKSGTPRFAETVWITEGGLKGDITIEKFAKFFKPHELKEWGDTILSVPGVGAWRLLLPIMKEMGVKNVVIAYDMDMIENIYVKDHLFNMVREFKNQHYNVRMSIWDENVAKGIDDLTLKNYIPDIRTL
ncbi:DUF3854 domain-containing protein (plasmid) [Alkalihalophilus sp. As8PL]|uniref:DUF3854 domain-containing protein n=1 Tax=Alkalihalophilus sp. As8PL TaxID=3237103 RepID=A0AB39BNE6_9BACI